MWISEKSYSFLMRRISELEKENASLNPVIPPQYDIMFFEDSENPNQIRVAGTLEIRPEYAYIFDNSGVPVFAVAANRFIYAKKVEVKE